MKSRKSKSKKFKKGRNKGHHRNNSGGGGAVAPARNRPRLRVPRRGEAPPWKTIGAAVAGSIGSAVASGLIVNQNIAKPETVALLMAATGGLGAYLTDGNARVAFTGVAAAGAGQFALVKLGRIAERKAERDAEIKAKAEVEAKAKAEADVLARQQAQLPAAPPVRQHASGRGVVVDLFRDAAADLELAEDDALRYSTRDADGDEDEDEDEDTPLEIDLDEAA